MHGDNMKLTQLQEKEIGIIENINLPAASKKRLFHLGFYNGAQISKERSAPLKDPCEYEICGNLVILRNEDARHIEVRIVDKGEECR